MRDMTEAKETIRKLRVLVQHLHGEDLSLVQPIYSKFMVDRNPFALTTKDAELVTTIFAKHYAAS